MSEDKSTVGLELPSSIRLLNETRRKMNEITQTLRAQQDVLRQRNTTLETDATPHLRKLNESITALERAITARSSRLKSLRALAHTAALINSSQGTDEVLNQVMETVTKLTGAERGYIVLKNRETGELEFRVARGIDRDQLAGSSGGVVISRSIVNQVADTGEPVLTDNASQDMNYANNQSIVGFQLRSILAVPLKVRDDIIGVVYTDNRLLTGLFKQEDLELMTAFASQAAVAIENAMLFETARASLEEATAIRDRMDNIFTSINSGIITLTHEGLIILCNQATEIILERTDIIGQPLQDVLPELDSSFFSLLERVLREGTEETIEIEPTLNGKPRYWQFIISPLRDENGDVIGLTVVLDDLTVQRYAEAQLVEVQRYLPAGLVNKSHEVDTRAQEREITAMFCDVRGFTSFSERLDPQTLMQVINKYLSIASDAVNFLDGVVDKYMGDAVTGLFNTQLNPQEDHAARAVQAALQLISDLHAQHEVLPEDQRLFYGIGIHTGAAVLGIVGGAKRKEFSAIGEAADIAKYLQEQAGAGEIVISASTYEAVKSQFECERMTEIKRHKAGYEDVVFYRVVKRKRGGTISTFIDQELLDLLNDDND